LEDETEFKKCPKCGCEEALIIAVGEKENLGKVKVFCPICDNYFNIEDRR